MAKLFVNWCEENGLDKEKIIKHCRGVVKKEVVDGKEKDTDVIYTKSTLSVITNVANYGKQVPLLDKKKECQEIKEELSWSKNTYFWICDKCGKLYTSSPNAIQSKINKNKKEGKSSKSHFLCKPCSGDGTTKKKNTGAVKDSLSDENYTLDEWLKIEGVDRKISVVGVYDKDHRIAHITDELDLTDISVNTSERKLIFHCGFHDKYQISEVRTLCGDNRHKYKVNHGKRVSTYGDSFDDVAANDIYMMKCCLDGFSLQDWCLLFYNYPFTTRVILKDDEDNDEDIQNVRLSGNYYEKLKEIERELITKYQDARIQKKCVEGIKRTLAKNIGESYRKNQENELEVENATLESILNNIKNLEEREKFYKKRIEIIDNSVTRTVYHRHTGAMVREYYLNYYKQKQSETLPFDSRELIAWGEKQIKLCCSESEPETICSEVNGITGCVNWCKRFNCRGCNKKTKSQCKTTRLTFTGSSVEEFQDFISEYPKLDTKELKQLVNEISTTKKSIKNGTPKHYHKDFQQAVSYLLKHNLRLQRYVIESLSKSERFLNTYEKRQKNIDTVDRGGLIQKNKRSELFIELSTMMDKILDGSELMDDITRRNLFGEDDKPCILISPDYIDSKYPYVVTERDLEMSNQDLLFGTPIRIKDEDVNNDAERTADNEDVDNNDIKDLKAKFKKGVHFLPKSLSEIKNIENISHVLIEPSNLSLLFNGISENAFDGKTLMAPSLPIGIKRIGRNAFTNCTINGRIEVYDSILHDLVSSGIKSHKYRIKQGGDLGTVHRESDTIGFIQYNDFFKIGEALRVYPNKLTLTREQWNTTPTARETEYINNFQFGTFYNSEDEMATSLLLSWHNIITISDVTAGLIDIYEKLNTH